jgi:hypothetical protein
MVCLEGHCWGVYRYIYYFVYVFIWLEYYYLYFSRIRIEDELLSDGFPVRENGREDYRDGKYILCASQLKLCWGMYSRYDIKPIDPGN